jgi:hypothetical protein
MSNFFARRGMAYINEPKRSCGALLGIGTGVLADGRLNDDEIQFLDRWLVENDAIANEYPGDVLHARIKAALADGVITEAERAHLLYTLLKLIGGTLEELAAATHVSELALDDVPRVEFPGARCVRSAHRAARRAHHPERHEKAALPPWPPSSPALHRASHLHVSTGCASRSPKPCMSVPIAIRTIATRVAVWPSVVVQNGIWSGLGVVRTTQYSERMATTTTSAPDRGRALQSQRMYPRTTPPAAIAAQEITIATCFMKAHLRPIAASNNA